MLGLKDKSPMYIDLNGNKSKKDNKLAGYLYDYISMTTFHMGFIKNSLKNANHPIYRLFATDDFYRKDLKKEYCLNILIEICEKFIEDIKNENSLTDSDKRINILNELKTFYEEQLGVTTRSLEKFGLPEDEKIL